MSRKTVLIRTMAKFSCCILYEANYQLPEQEKSTKEKPIVQHDVTMTDKNSDPWLETGKLKENS